MALLITVVTGGPTHVLIFPTRWLVAATIFSSRGLGRVDPSGQGGTLKPGAARAAIATIFMRLLFWWSWRGLLVLVGLER